MGDRTRYELWHECPMRKALMTIVRFDPPNSYTPIAYVHAAKGQEDEAKRICDNVVEFRMNIPLHQEGETP